MSVSVTARPEPPAGWTPLVRRLGSFYHEPAWAAGLAAAFGFAIHYVVAEQGGAVVGALPLAEVRGLTGTRRLVSLPFSYCAGPVAADDATAHALCASARELAARVGARRVEIKHAPLSAFAPAPGFERLSRYATYRVDTSGDERALFKRLHQSATQRGIRKAEKEGVVVDRGEAHEDWTLMARLQAETSHRHGLPAPPDAWFTVTCAALQRAGLADLYVARLADGRAAAAITLWKGAREWIYAFGAARPETLEFRPNHALLWRAMRDAAAAGLPLDLGRAAPEQEGLVQFKERWGGVPVPLAYDYWPGAGGLNAAPRDRGPIAIVNRLWSALPFAVARRGSFLYRYMG